MKSFDIILIGALCLLGAIAFLLSDVFAGDVSGHARVEIYVNGNLEQTVSPAVEPQEIVIETEKGTNTLLVDAQGAKMIAADCHSQDCVHTAKQTTAGGVIACLPHRVLVKLTGDFEGGVDAIAN